MEWQKIFIIGLIYFNFKTHIRLKISVNSITTTLSQPKFYGGPLVTQYVKIITLQIYKKGLGCKVQSNLKDMNLCDNVKVYEYIFQK